MNSKDIKIVFEPGCFDSFDGTQEELDAMLAEIQQLVESGKIFEQSEVVIEDEMPEWVAEQLANLDSEERKRKLN